MTAGTAWLDAFPLEEADRAVEALLRGWADMAKVHRPHFNPATQEPKLTRVVRAYVRKKIAVQMKLLGHWGTEGVENEVDFETGEIQSEGRTDVCYYWNNSEMKFVLVFEFKKLSDTNEARKHYLHKGVQQFVGGLYADKEPIALMVGILMSPAASTVQSLRRAIETSIYVVALNLCRNEESRCVLPPSAFPLHTQFDTEHTRAPAKAPAHGTIRIAHAFVEFPYIDYAAVRNAKRRRAEIIEEEGDGAQ